MTRYPSPGLLLFVAALLLAGCGLPPAITIASLMIDGVSYATSGKSASNHVLSAVVNEDCAVWRGVVEADIESVCLDEAENGETPSPVDGEVTVAEADVVYEEERDLLASFASAPIEVEPIEPIEPIAVFAPGKSDQEVQLAALGTEPDLGTDPFPVTVVESLTGSHATFLVVGSFRSTSNANLFAARLDVHSASVVPVVVGGRTYRRVVTGPFPRGALAAARARLRLQGVESTWAINLCTADMNPPPCRSMVLAAAPAPSSVAR